MTKERFVRFSSKRDGKTSYGLLIAETITPLSGPPWEKTEPCGEPLSLAEAVLHAPVKPSKILCIGLNYPLHVTASQSADKAPEQPLVFLKPPSSIIGPGEAIIYPAQSERVDYEAELAIVIGRRTRNISEKEYESAIFGYTCANDVTARDLQKKDGQWGRAKGFDSFCPVGPWIVPSLEGVDVTVEGIHNSQVRQSGKISQMIFAIPFLISYLSSIFTLLPGDLILTGTPAGIAPMQPGDTIEVRIQGIGSLINQLTK